ncbi:MAG: HNH endonuclease signature motif containing protein [Pseudomonadota bacterium]
MRRLQRLYPRTRTAEIARRLGRPLSGVASKANDLGLRKPDPCRKWTAREIRLLRQRYAETPALEIAVALNRKRHEIYYQAGLLKLRKSRSFKSRFMKQQIAKNGPLWGRRWTREQIQQLRALYPDHPTKDIAKIIGHGVSSCYRMAKLCGLKKTPAYTETMLRRVSGKLKESGKSHRFTKGHVPANKGQRRPGYAPGRMRETQFKKGQMAGGAQKKWVPIGTEVRDDAGYLKRKVSDDRSKASRFNWRFVHVLLWEEAYGPVPPGYAVKFIDDNRGNVILGNLCLVSRGDLARLNVMWNRYPRELCEVIHMRGILNRRIKRRLKDEEQHRRSA